MEVFVSNYAQDNYQVSHLSILYVDSQTLCLFYMEGLGSHFFDNVSKQLKNKNRLQRKVCL